jgi:hypothetical protein
MGCCPERRAVSSHCSPSARRARTSPPGTVRIVKTAAIVAVMLIRVCAVVLIALGVLFWTGNALPLVPLHILVGLVLVLSLWTLAGIAARAGVSLPFVAAAFVWGLVVSVFGLSQDTILTGAAHWLIRVLHLLVGLVAVGIGEGLAARIRRADLETARA